MKLTEIECRDLMSTLLIHGLIEEGRRFDRNGDVKKARMCFSKALEHSVFLESLKLHELKKPVILDPRPYDAVKFFQ